MQSYPTNEEVQQTDAALVSAAKRGDRDAFDQLVRRHEQRVFRLAQRVTKNREDAEDVVQETFQRAFLHLHGFEERARFSTWVTRIALNESFMLLRRSRSGIEACTVHCDEEVKVVSETFVDQQPGPELSCWRRERSEVLKNAIDKLSTPLRNTVMLREFGELSVKETAKALGTTVPTVKTRLHHVRRKLRSILDPDLVREFHTARAHNSNVYSMGGD